MDGIVCINKPQNFTSFDVVAVMRRCFNTKKAGHGGTLDPMATGVLPIFIGRATKAADLIPDSGKSYRAGFKLGLASDTQDIWGTVISRGESSVSSARLLDELNGFRGEIEQVPPMYSALKVNGQKLCNLARRGIDVERKARRITVFRLELKEFDGTEGTIEVDCSSGTYIRTLINDIGEAVGTGAVMTSLCRTRSCGFTLDKCRTIEEMRLADEHALEQSLLPVESVFSSLGSVVLDGTQQRLYINGARLDVNRLGRLNPNISGIKRERLLRVYFENGVFFGVAKINDKDELVGVARFSA